MSEIKSDKDLLRNRILKNAPCGYLSWNEATMKDRTQYPRVDCELDCENCGWNPTVAERRIQKLMLNTKTEVKDYD